MFLERKRASCKSRNARQNLLLFVCFGITYYNVLQKNNSPKSSPCSWNKTPAELLVSFCLVKIQSFLLFRSHSKANDAVPSEIPITFPQRNFRHRRRLLFQHRRNRSCICLNPFGVLDKVSETLHQIHSIPFWKVCVVYCLQILFLIYRYNKYTFRRNQCCSTEWLIALKSE